LLSSFSSLQYKTDLQSELGQLQIGLFLYLVQEQHASVQSIGSTPGVFIAAQVKKIAVQRFRIRKNAELYLVFFTLTRNKCQFCRRL